MATAHLGNAAFAFCVLISARPMAGAHDQEWPYYGADQGGSKYSPLAQINKANVHNLNLAWQWKTGEQRLAEYGTSPGIFEVTPIMTGGVLYLSTPYNRVVALDPASGRELWSYDPKAYEDGQVPNGTGFVHRGVAT
jgi:quinoprotein glucose dehydrogenase